LASKAYGDTNLAAELKCNNSRIAATYHSMWSGGRGSGTSSGGITSGGGSDPAAVLLTAGLSRKLLPGTTIIAKANTERVVSCVVKTSLAAGASVATSLQWRPADGKKGGVLPKLGIHVELW
jgi:hypothetical protein